MAVVMRVMVEEDFRQRLKVVSVALGISMGDLVQRMATSGETIGDLEKLCGISEGKREK